MGSIWREGSAVFSKCRRYRYALSRAWSDSLPSVLFIGLNPSTADATRDDPTIRRCIRFARDWGYGSLLMGNIFAYRSTLPEVLEQVDDPVGPRNNWWLGKFAREAELVVAAWGIHGALLNRGEKVLRRLGEVKGRREVKCLGVTKAGHPKHPLYLSAKVKAMQYQGLAGDLDSSNRRSAGIITH